MRIRVALSAVALVAMPVAAQQRTYTPADYAKAERFMSYNTTPLVFGTLVRPTWLADDRFWYRSLTPTGTDLVLVDPAKATRVNVLAEPRLAAALKTALGAAQDSLRAASTQTSYSADGSKIEVVAGGSQGRAESDGIL